MKSGRKTLLGVFFFLALFALPSVHAAIDVLGTGFAATGEGGQPGDFSLSSGVYSFSFDAGERADMLVIGLSVEKSSESSPIPYTVTYGGEALTQAVQSNTKAGASIWYLAHPRASGTIEIDFSGVGTMNGFGIGIVALNGQGYEIALHTSNSSAGSSSVELTTTLADCFVMVAADSNATLGSPSMNAPLTSIGTNKDVGSNQLGFGYENRVAAGPHTYTWSPDADARGMAAAAFVATSQKATPKPEPTSYAHAGPDRARLRAFCALKDMFYQPIRG